MRGFSVVRRAMSGCRVRPRAFVGLGHGHIHIVMRVERIIAAGPGASMNRRIWISIALIAIGLAPMLSVISAGMIASLNGCELHEGMPQPCMVSGRDIGGILHTMTVMGWLMLVSLLFLAGGVLALAQELIRKLIQKVSGK